MRREWEKFRGPIVKLKLKTSASHKRFKKWVKGMKAQKPQSGKTEEVKGLPEEEWPQERMDTGTVD